MIVSHRSPLRRLAWWLACLALALLPLRGMASVVMPLLMQAPVKAGPAMPCHGDVEVAAATDTAPADDSADRTCAMCDLCHAAAAALPIIAPQWPMALPAALPLADAVRVLPSVRDGPERPPRA
jgi:hypothetical protein